MPDGTLTLGIHILCLIFRAQDRLAISMRKSEISKKKLKDSLCIPNT